MKKFLCGIIFLIMIFSLAFSVNAENDIEVRLDGETIAFDVAPKIINDRTMVPLRAIFEALGADVQWEEKTSTVKATKDNTEIILVIGDDEMKVNKKTLTLDSPPVIVDSRTLVPLRAIAESFNIRVMWEPMDRIVMLYTKVRAISKDGTIQSIPIAEIQKYEQKGYTIDNIIPIYSCKDGIVLFVRESEAKKYNEDDWSREAIVEMFPKEGESFYVKISEVEKYKSEGYNTEPYVLMYAKGGKQEYVPSSQVEAQKLVGWYDEPLYAIYSSDGSVDEVTSLEAFSYILTGDWYLDKYTANIEKYKKSSMTGYEKLKAYITENGEYDTENDLYIISIPVEENIVLTCAYFNKEDIIVVEAFIKQGREETTIMLFIKEGYLTEVEYSYVDWNLNPFGFGETLKGYYSEGTNEFVEVSGNVANKEYALDLINATAETLDILMNSMNSSVEELGIKYEKVS